MVREAVGAIRGAVGVGLGAWPGRRPPLLCQGTASSEIASPRADRDEQHQDGREHVQDRECLTVHVLVAYVVGEVRAQD